MQIAGIINSLKSFNLILSRLLSYKRIAINNTRIPIENLRNNNVIGSIPFSLKFLTKTPLEPDNIPQIIGKINISFSLLNNLFLYTKYILINGVY